MRTSVTPLAFSTARAASAPVMPRALRMALYFLNVLFTRALVQREKSSAGTTSTRYDQSK